MPLYFGTVAPTCPISTDSSTGPREAHRFNHNPKQHRTSLPFAYDLKSAIMIANLARSIVSATVRDSVRNNTKQAKGGGKVSIGKDKYKNKAARWVEQKDKRVKKKYKYYGRDADGREDKTNYVTMERIERMVWYDKAWKSYLIWTYGDKGEGTPI
jgi:hypothetical protein